MHRAHAFVKQRLEYNVLVQGTQARWATLESFRDDEFSILFATASFWEGVDIPGKTLSQVIVDKLPFEPPHEPLADARKRQIEAHGGSAFWDYLLPRAALGFRQGFGRLIRRRSDRGVISVLDPRLLQKSYGRYFLNSLPQMRRTSALEQVRRWWRAEPLSPNLPLASEANLL